MSQVEPFVPHSFAGLQDQWAPSERLRGWLLVGIGALVVDLVLGAVAAVLEMKHWGRDGLTPDVLVQYIAIVPQAIVVAAYLALAREAGARGLWKSAAGLFASYLLLSLLSLVQLEVAKGGAATIVIWTAVIGAAGLAIFSLSKFPKFERAAAAPQSADELEAALSGNADATTDEALSGADLNDEQLSEKPEAKKAEEQGFGCWGHVAVGIGVLALKAFTRGRNNWLANLGLGADGWSLIVLAILAAFALGYAFWFAGAKIACRDRLGGMAAFTGLTEMLIALVHIGMAMALLYFLVTAVADPQFNEAKFEKQLDPWLLRGSLASSGCHALWVVVTIGLFTVLRMRGEPDWRAQFVTPQA